MESNKTVQHYSNTEFIDALQSGAIVVDVREKDETEELIIDVENMVFMPLSELNKRYQELPRNQKILLVCRKGNRSKQAATFLAKHGYVNICTLKDGINDWVLNDFPTKGDTASIVGGGSCIETYVY